MTPALAEPTGCLPPLTRPAWRVLAALAILFVASVAACLNGSSSSFWSSGSLKDLRTRDVPNGLLLSLPKQIRGDEWSVWTPAMLNQARQHPSFPVENATLGPGATPLLLSLPARHYTMIFHPHLWGFFALPFDFAFSWYWNVKVFGLFAGMFLLCWALTDGRLGYALFGAMAVQFSPFVQWWFSTPAMMPEMLSWWALGLVAAMRLFLPGNPLPAVGALTFCAAAFFLCCYPAFEIPLVYLGLCVLAGYLWQRGLFSWRGAVWVGAAVTLAALALAPWFHECLPALRAEAGTIYPGQRRMDGGDVPLIKYLSGFLNLAINERNCPPGLWNACEAANFFPLWLLALALGAVSFGRFARGGDGRWQPWLRQRALKITLAAYLAAVTLYMFVRLPPWLAGMTLIDRSHGSRCMLTLGVAGTLFLLLSLAARTPASARTKWAAVLAWGIFVVGILVGAARMFPGFLSFWTGAALAAAAIFLAAAYLPGPRWLLPVGWAVIFVPGTALINPVCVSLPELLDSPMMNRLGAMVRSDPAAQWAVYDSVIGAELVKAAGARVVNGLRLIPDPELIRKLDPTGRDRDVYARYGHLCFVSAPYEQGVTASVDHLVFIKIGIHPRRLRELFPGVKYIVSIHPEPDFAGAGFQLIDHAEANNLWLYALPSGY